MGHFGALSADQLIGFYRKIASIAVGTIPLQEPGLWLATADCWERNMTAQMAQRQLKRLLSRFAELPNVRLSV